MQDISTSLNILYQQAGKRHLFLQDPLPYNLINGKYFNGINLLLLGTNPLTYKEPRWACGKQIMSLELVPENNEYCQNILIWKDNTDFNSCRSIPCYNLKTLDLPFVRHTTPMVLSRELLEEYKVPYNTHHNLRYDAFSKHLMIAQDSDIQAALLPLISLYMMQLKPVFNLNPYLHGKYLQLVHLITEARLLQYFGIDCFYLTNFNLALETIKELYEKNYQQELVYAFIFSDRIITSMFNNHHLLPENILQYFMPISRANQLLNSLNPKHLKALIENMTKCKHQNSGRHDIAYVHFVTPSEDTAEHQDFYVTDILNDSLYGVVLNAHDCYYAQFSIEEVDNNYVLDLLFEPKKIS